MGVNQLIVVSAAIILSDGKILIAKRGKSKSLANLWEFPGGKVEANEAPEQCVKREIKEELNMNIKVLRYYSTNIHKYEFGVVKLIAFLAKYESGKIELREHADYKWVTIDELTNYPFAPADIPIVEKLEREGQSFIL